MPVEIAAIVRPFDPSLARSKQTVSSRVFHAVDAFAAALAEATGRAVPVIEGTMGNAPPTGYLLVFNGVDVRGYTQLERHAGRTSRVVLAACGRDVRLEKEGYAAAIDHSRYFRWQHYRDEESGRGLIGLRAVAAAMRATCDGPYRTEHYATLSSAEYPDLPRLLAGYLAAHAALHVSQP